VAACFYLLPGFEQFRTGTRRNKDDPDQDRNKEDPVQDRNKVQDRNEAQVRNTDKDKDDWWGSPVTWGDHDSYCKRLRANERLQNLEKKNIHLEERVDYLEECVRLERKRLDELWATSEASHDKLWQAVLRITKVRTTPLRNEEQGPERGQDRTGTGPQRGQGPPGPGPEQEQDRNEDWTLLNPQDRNGGPGMNQEDIDDEV
jgi:hypothetical protein